MLHDQCLRPLASFLYVSGLVSEDADTKDMIMVAEQVHASLLQLIGDLHGLNDDASDDSIQYFFYEAGKLHFGSNLRWWFEVLYRILLRQKDGPRLGQFTKIMTIDWVTNRMQETINDPWNISLIHAKDCCIKH
jgi:lysyl-tRNA synthetase class I